MLLSFGSINVDVTLKVKKIVRPGETISSSGLAVHGGGKGANQSVALARAGAKVFHAGQVGEDTRWMRDLLEKSGVDVSLVLVSPEIPGGQAFIQVHENGQNAIIVHGGANQAIPSELISRALSLTHPGDWLLLQNEINLTPELIRAGHDAGLVVCLNPAPMTPEVAKEWPLELVDILIVNEIEGMELAGLPVNSFPETILETLASRYPKTRICLTLGSKGSIYKAPGSETYFQGAFSVDAVDTTGAGDTFTGFLLAEMMRGSDPQTAMRIAARAAALAVSRHGAIESIPNLCDLGI